MAQAMGFYTDTTVCIGCKACQVACHQWNGLPAELAEQPSATRPGKSLPITGNSYDNTGSFSDVNWRHVKFIEKSERPDRRDLAWLMMSDVCKHCVNAPCLEVCPTGAIIRTEFDSVYIQASVCNGCRVCVSGCPFGVIHMGGTENAGQGTAKKCTLCYDQQFPLRAGQPLPAVSMEQALSGLIIDSGLITVESCSTRTQCSVAHRRIAGSGHTEPTMFERRVECANLSGRTRSEV